MQHKLTSHI